MKVQTIFSKMILFTKNQQPLMMIGVLSLYCFVFFRFQLGLFFIFNSLAQIDAGGFRSDDIELYRLLFNRFANAGKKFVSSDAPREWPKK